MSTLRTGTVTLGVRGGGTGTMNAFMARPRDTGPFAGLLLFQEAYGVNAHIRDVASRFAALGYNVIAPELFHRTAPGFQGEYGDFESVRPHVAALTPAGLEADIRAAHGWLAADPGTDPAKIAAVGFCLGGRVAFLANLLVPVAGSASFYGRGIAPELLSRLGELHGPTLCVWGGKDQHIGLEAPRSLADALRAAGKPHVHVEVADADHGFFNDAAPRYHAAAARETWALLVQFLSRATS